MLSNTTLTTRPVFFGDEISKQKIKAATELVVMKTLIKRFSNSDWTHVSSKIMERAPEHGKILLSTKGKILAGASPTDWIWLE